MVVAGRGWCLVIAGNNKQASEQDQVHGDDDEARIQSTALKDNGAIEPEGKDCSGIKRGCDTGFFRRITCMKRPSLM